MHNRLVSMLLVASCGLVSTARAQMTFDRLGFVAGGTDSHATGISADGQTLVGWGFGGDGTTHPFMWTKALGMHEVPVQGIAWAISGDGATITGGPAGPNEAFIWSEAGGYIGLGTLPGFDDGSYAVGISFDGSIAVGLSQGGQSQQAFRWSAADGMQGLGDLPGGPFLSRAYGISADGGVIVGQSQIGPNSYEAFRWTEQEGMVGIGYLEGGSSDASAVSADGSVIIGTSLTQTGQAAYRWTAEGGMVNLSGPDGPDSYGGAVSADGSIIVGGYWAPDFGSFVWDEHYGMRDLQDLLETQLDLDGWTQLMAWDTSADGRTIVGEGVNPEGLHEGWIATIPAPSAAFLLGVVGAAAARRRTRS